jgi:hypothetical protein
VPLPPAPTAPPRARGKTHPPPSRSQPAVVPNEFEDVHSAPTMIIDVGRVRGRRG